MALGFSSAPVDQDAVDAGDYANLPTAMQAGGAYSTVMPSVVAAAQQAPAAAPDPSAMAAPSALVAQPQPDATAPPSSPPQPYRSAVAAHLDRVLGVPDQSAPAAPAASLAPQGQASGVQPVYPAFARKPIGPFEAIGDALLGGLPTAISNANYKRSLVPLQIQQFRNAQAVVEANANKLTPGQLAAARADPMGFQAQVEATWAPATLSEGQTRIGVGSNPYTAPKLVFNNGRYGTQTPQGFGQTGSAGPTFTTPNDSGVSVDTTGQAAPSFTPTVRDVAPGHTISPLAPLNGAPGSVGISPSAAPSAALSGPPAAVAAGLSQRWTAQGVAPADQAALLATGKIESSLKPGAQNGRSTGLFQFQPATFKAVGGTDISDPGQQADAAAKLWASNRASLTGKLGQAPTDDQLYLAHQQGAGGAAALIKADPNANAIQTLVQAGIYTTPSQARRAITNNGGTRAMTAGDFVQHWQQKFGGALQSVGGDAPAPATSTAAASPANGANAYPSSIQGQTKTAPVYNPKTEQWEQTAPDGTVDKTGTSPFGFDQKRALLNDATSTPEWKDYTSAAASLNGLHAAMAKMAGNNGVIDNAATDSYYRNMAGGVARPGGVKVFMEHLGFPQDVQGKVLGLTGNGYLTPSTLKQMDDVMGAYAQAKGVAAKQAVAPHQALAKSYGGDLGLTMPALDPPPKVQWLDKNAPTAAAPPLQELLAERARRQASRGGR